MSRSDATGVTSPVPEYDPARMVAKRRAVRALAGAGFAAVALGAAAPAQAATEIRFVHAVPGAGPATLQVKGGEEEASVSGVRFGHAGGFASAPQGKVRLALRPAEGGKPLAIRTDALRDARYTVVAARVGDGVDLRLYRDGSAPSGTARVRVIHAATELMDARVRLGDLTIDRSLKPGASTGYRQVEPGSYDLTVTRPGGKGSLAEQKGLALSAGTATTAVVVGSGGEPTRFVVIPDDTSAPSQAPATGLGGLSDEQTPWALALLAGLLAAATGGGCWTLASRVRRGRAG